MARPLRIDLEGRNSLLWVAISIVPRIIVNAFAPEKVNGKLTEDSGFLNGELRDDVCDKIEFTSKTVRNARKRTRVSFTA